MVDRIIINERSLGLTEAAKRINHWRDGSGTPLPLEENWLSESSEIEQTIFKLQKLYESNPAKQASGNSLYQKAKLLRNGDTNVKFTDNWKAAIKNVNPLSDFGASVGNLK